MLILRQNVLSEEKKEKNLGIKRLAQQEKEIISNC